jgi:hypothetical protein
MNDDFKEFDEEDFKFDDYDLDAYETFEQEPGSRRFMGMSSAQRFFLAFLFLIAVFVVGTICLVVTDKIQIF